MEKEMHYMDYALFLPFTLLHYTEATQQTRSPDYIAVTPLELSRSIHTDMLTGSSLGKVCPADILNALGRSSIDVDCGVAPRTPRDHRWD
ncbi:hypothetical protein F2P81_001174 [Scophthalmus maximus]|uniref:Uncharacterized protein n=1 Tax=Scophthalmus maximus TaxID=52904 RepID=A0A6A4TYH3_SCOMX|nr:hypothetical protein F2P81_001174 [Scophthalmus maximus]